MGAHRRSIVRTHSGIGVPNPSCPMRGCRPSPNPTPRCRDANSSTCCDRRIGLPPPGCRPSRSDTNRISCRMLVPGRSCGWRRCSHRTRGSCYTPVPCPTWCRRQRSRPACWRCRCRTASWTRRCPACRPSPPGRTPWRPRRRARTASRPRAGAGVRVSACLC